MTTPTTRAELDKLTADAIAKAKKITDRINGAHIPLEDSGVLEAVRDYKTELAAQAADTSTRIKRRTNGRY